MAVPGAYDETLQMFISMSRDPEARYLRFLRWLAEHDQMEHGVAGPPAGIYGLYAQQQPDPVLLLKQALDSKA